MINGVVSFYKPDGFTSYDIVNIVKDIVYKYYTTKNIKIKKKKIKVGHGGTLDKLAEGVLIIGIGNGTKKLQDYLKGDKQYIATGHFGKETDTLDRGGQFIKNCEYDHIDKESFENILEKFIGEIDQIPPVYSALKKKGKRASDLIRAGEKVEMKSRKVKIYDIEVMEFNLPKFVIKVSCGGGTYIRSLIRDIGLELNSCAFMEKLNRTKQGVFTIDDTIKVTDINVDYILDKTN